MRLRITIADHAARAWAKVEDGETFWLEARIERIIREEMRQNTPIDNSDVMVTVEVDARKEEKPLKLAGGMREIAIEKVEVEERKVTIEDLKKEGRY